MLVQKKPSHNSFCSMFNFLKVKQAQTTQTEGFCLPRLERLDALRKQSFFLSPEKRKIPWKQTYQLTRAHCWTLKDEWDQIILSELIFPIKTDACFPGGGHVNHICQWVMPIKAYIHRSKKEKKETTHNKENNYISDSGCSFSANGLLNVASVVSSLAKFSGVSGKGGSE